MTGRAKRSLVALPIEPRASLEAEIVGRFVRGERTGPAGPAAPVGRLSLIVLLLLLTSIFQADYRGDTWSWEPRAGVDRCCQDLDGGGAADDGILVEAANGEDVSHLLVYEDQTHQGHWTLGNLVRYERRAGGPAFRTTRSGSNLRVHQVCCADYDGGPDHDDGVFVVLSDSNDVMMAAVFTNAPHSPENTILR